MKRELERYGRPLALASTIYQDTGDVELKQDNRMLAFGHCHLETEQWTARGGWTIGGPLLAAEHADFYAIGNEAEDVIYVYRIGDLLQRIANPDGLRPFNNPTSRGWYLDLDDELCRPCWIKPR